MKMKIGEIKTLNKIPSKYYAIIAFFLSCICMYMVLSYSGVLSTGKYCILEGDLLEIYVPAIKELCRDILNGQSIYYSWTHMLGMNQTLMNAIYAMSPFNIVYLLLFKVDECLVTAGIMIFKAGLAAAFFQIFSRNVLKIEGFCSVLFSLLYALCSYQVSFNTINVIWTDGFLLLPLVITLIYHLRETGGWVGLTIAYAFLFVSNFYIGYVVGFFSFLYFVLLLIIDHQKTDLKIALKYLASVVLAIMISGAVWIPVGIFLFNNNPADATGFESICSNILDILFQFFFGQNNSSIDKYPNLYCGILSILLIPLFFYIKDIKIKHKIIYGSLLFISLISCIITPLYAFWHAFDAPDGWYFRFSFIISFLICVMALMVFESLKENWLKIILITGVCYSIFYIAYIAINSTRDDLPRLPLIFGLINISLIIIWIVLIFFYLKVQEQNKNVIIMLFILISGLELIGNGYSSFYRNNYYQVSTEEFKYKQWSDSLKYMMNSLEADDSFYRVNYNYDIMCNSDTYFGFNGVSDFCSSENPEVRKSLTKLGVYSSTRVLRQYGLNDLTKMILNVKYDVDGVIPSIVRTDEEYPTIKENEYVLPIGFMVDNSFSSFKFDSDNAFDNNNALLSSMTGEEMLPFKKISNDKIIVESNGISLSKVSQGYLIKLEGDKRESYLDLILNDDIDNKCYMWIDNYQSILNRDSFTTKFGVENVLSNEGFINISYIKPFDYADNKKVIRIIYYKPEEQIIKDYYVYSLDNNELSRAYDNLSQNVFDIEIIKDGYVKGKVNSASDKNLLFTSIPYDKGWKVSVDGVEKEYISLIEGAFIGIEIPEVGVHEIEMYFEPKGLKIGYFVSVLGVLMTIVYILIDKLNMKTR